MRTVKTLLAALLLLPLQTLSYGAPFFAVPNGTIHGVYVKYKDADEVTILTGFGECNGHYFEVTTNTDVPVSDPNADDFIYIYVDDDSSYPAPTFVTTTTEPAWSDAKQGWYNGDDRCIGAVRWDDTHTEILPYNYHQTQYILSDELVIVHNGNPGSSATLTTTGSDYTPVNCDAVYMHAFNTDYGSRAVVGVTPQENTDYLVENMATDTVDAYGWLSLCRDSTREFYWEGADDDDNAFDLEVVAYQIER